MANFLTRRLEAAAAPALIQPFVRRGRKPVAPVISGPTGGALLEGNSLGAIVGVFTSSLPSVWGLSGADAAAFSISQQGILTLRVVTDYEAKSTYTVFVRATANGLTAQHSFAFTVSNDPRDDVLPPSIIGGATSYSLIEAVYLNTVISQYQASAPVVWSLAGQDAARFSISQEGVLTFSATTDFESAKRSYMVTVVATNTAGIATRPLTLSVSNNEADDPITIPLVIAPGPASVSLLESAELPAALMGFTADQPVTWDLVGEEALGFSITTGGTLYRTGQIDFEDDKAHIITVRATGSSGLTATRTITLAILDVADGPELQPLTLDPSFIVENSAGGSLVGAVHGKTAGSTLSLLNTAGSRFALSGQNIVAGVTPTNFEAVTFHDIVVLETLAGSPNSPRQTPFTIAVTNDEADDAVWVIVGGTDKLTIVRTPPVAAPTVIGGTAKLTITG